jgi:hypothetical protein
MMMSRLTRSMEVSRTTESAREPDLSMLLLLASRREGCRAAS